jgi:hypothetical protein
MGVGYNPGIVTSNLVFSYDAANPKSLNIPTQADHGWSDWICVFSGTATYSIVDSGVTIWQRTNTGVITSVVGPSTGPTRGSLSVTAGFTYYSTGGPINLVVEDQHHSIIPLTMAGTLFWHSAARNPPLNIYVYAPFSNATVNFYDNVASGISSAASNTVNISTGNTVVFITSNIHNFVTSSSGQSWITANVPVIVSATMTGSDKTILSPMADYVYRRYISYVGAPSNNTTGVSSTEFTVYSNIVKVMDMSIADGSGGDSAQALGLEYLSDMYSWGNTLSDYTIISPYDNTFVSVEFWDSANSAWRILENHTITGGTITNAVRVMRDGTAGVGNTATVITGATNNFNTSNLWKWTGTKPFYLCINDSADDEFSVLGWRQSTYYNKPRSGNTWINMVNGANNLTIVGGAISNNGTMTFGDNQITQYCVNSSFPYPTEDSTQEVWFYKKGGPKAGAALTYSVGGDNHQLYYFTDTVFQPWSLANNTTITISSIANTWTHAVRTRSKNGGLESFYINGSLIGTLTSAPGTSLTSGGDLIVGQEADASMATGGGFDPNQNLNGSVGRISIYNRALTAQEIKQNFNATRGRYGV